MAWRETRPFGNYDKAWVFGFLSTDGMIQYALQSTSTPNDVVSKDAGEIWSTDILLGYASDRHAFSKSGQHILKSPSDGNLYISHDYGTSFTQILDFSEYNSLFTNPYALCISDDGQTIYATSSVIQTGRRAYIIRSTDGGSNWTDLTFQYSGKYIGFDCLKCSSDGTVLIGGINNTSHTQKSAWISTDSGTNWSQKTINGITTGRVQHVALSSDGSIFYAIIVQSKLYKSTDGSTFSLLLPMGSDVTNDGWTSLSCDNSGNTVIVSSQSATVGGLWKSSDQGENWSEETPAGSDKRYSFAHCSADGNVFIAAEVGKRLWVTTPSQVLPEDWTSVAISSDGTYMIAASATGKLYVSSNSGGTWTERTPAGSGSFQWRTVSISGTGQKMTAGIKGGRFFISTDYGVTWSEETPTGTAESKDWMTSAINKDGPGSLFIVGIYGGRLYIAGEIYIGGIKYPKNFFMFIPIKF